MDYRYYQGEPNKKFQAFLNKYKKYIFYLEYFGVLLFFIGILINFLIVIHIIESNLVLVIISYAMMVLGGPIHLIGKSFNNRIDKSR